MGTKTLRRGEAHDAVDAAAQMGALSHLAAHWDMAGHWNADAEWTAAALHEHVNDCAEMLRDGRSGRNPKDSDRTGLEAWEGVL
jgi:hypothetical protein